MVSQPLRVILDDNVADFNYGPEWELNAQVMWYQGGTHFPSFNHTTFAFFNLSFEGEYHVSRQTFLLQVFRAI